MELCNFEPAPSSSSSGAPSDVATAAQLRAAADAAEASSDELRKVTGLIDALLRCRASCSPAAQAALDELDAATHRASDHQQRASSSLAALAGTSEAGRSPLDVDDLVVSALGHTRGEPGMDVMLSSLSSAADAPMLAPVPLCEFAFVDGASVKQPLDMQRR
jgi:hypothetical protein